MCIYPVIICLLLPKYISKSYKLLSNGVNPNSPYLRVVMHFHYGTLIF